MSDGFETRAIHAGQDPDPATGSCDTPCLRIIVTASCTVSVGWT